MSLLLALTGAAPSGVSLSLSAVEGADTCSASVGLALGMSLSATEGADLASAGVGLAISASLAATEGADLCASNVSLLIMAAMAAVEGADLCSASVSASVSVALAATEGADTCSAVVDLVAVPSEAGTDQTKYGGGGIYPPLGATAGAGLHVPYRHSKRVDEDGYETDEPIVPATPMPEAVSAPKRASINLAEVELEASYQVAMAEAQAIATLQTKAVIDAAEALKVKHRNHALRLLLLAS